MPRPRFHVTIVIHLIMNMTIVHMFVEDVEAITTRDVSVTFTQVIAELELWLGLWN